MVLATQRFNVPVDKGALVKEGDMKAIIGGVAAFAALGAVLLLANTRSMPGPAQAWSPVPAVASTSALTQTGPFFLDCGEGRLALVRPVSSGQQFSLVQCAPAADLHPAAAQEAAPERVVYQERVAYREQPLTRTADAAPPRTYRAATGPRSQPPKQVRPWQKSALIIGGSAAGGAGVGALLGGKSGAAKGAVVGGIGGLVYDLATRGK